MLVIRRPGASTRPVGFRSYSPSMLFMWMPVPGTMTPEPEPVDAESEAALPSTSTTEMCVVPPGGAGSGAPRTWASMRRSAASMRLVGEEVLREPAVVQPRREAALPRPTLLAHDLDERRDRLRRARRAVRQPVEQRQPVADQDPARGRRRIRLEDAAVERARAPGGARSRGSRAGRPAVTAPPVSRRWPTIARASSPVYRSARVARRAAPSSRPDRAGGGRPRRRRAPPRMP